MTTSRLTTQWDLQAPRFPWTVANQTCCGHRWNATVEELGPWWSKPQWSMIMSRNLDNSDAMNYVKSLRDAVKRRFGAAYLRWIRSGRIGAPPDRRHLAPVLARAMTLNLDILN